MMMQNLPVRTRSAPPPLPSPSDLAIQLTLQHCGVMYQVTLGGDDTDIHSVIEAVDYALRGIGFDAKIIHGAMALYGVESDA